MALNGSCSDESIEHDDVSSWQHERDKRAQTKRLAGNVEWIPVMLGEEFKFRNDFSAFGKDEALYFNFGGIPNVRTEELKPESWDTSGTLASYSAGSQIAAYREFKRSQGRARRGRKKENHEGLEYGPPAPPSKILLSRELSLNPIDPEKYKSLLKAVRDETSHYHCWGTGGSGDNKRGQWKKTPIATKLKIIEGMLPADLLDRDDTIEGLDAGEPIVVVKTAHEMERYTVNSHPALARAMAKLLASGKKDKVRELMKQAMPRVIRKFEEVTGRKVVGASIHWDSDLPHWNLWHTGLERVTFKNGKGKERERYRRTAMNMCSSGPGLRAWRRSQLALERMGKPTCPATKNELLKAEKKAMEDQGRLPGDWQCNDAADSALEELLIKGGFKDLVDEGFADFVANEEKRHQAGLAGKVSRMDMQTMATEINGLKSVIAERDSELEEIKSASLYDRTIRVLVINLIGLLNNHPVIKKLLEDKVPGMKEVLNSLRLFSGAEKNPSLDAVHNDQVENEGKIQMD